MKGFFNTYPQLALVLCIVLGISFLFGSGTYLHVELDLKREKNRYLRQTQPLRFYVGLFVQTFVTGAFGPFYAVGIWYKKWRGDYDDPYGEITE